MGYSRIFLKNLKPETKEKIIFTGYVQDEYIKELYKSALCFMYPSFYEGFGLPPLEAMACGTPVILSDRGSLPEVFGKIAADIGIENFNKYVKFINTKEIILNLIQRSISLRLSSSKK